MPNSTVLSTGRSNLKAENRRTKSNDILVARESVDLAERKNILREMNLKITAQRLAILEGFTRGRAHVTAQEMYERIKQNHPEIGFATVYRFLRELSHKGFATEVRMGGLPARYELTPKSHHDHLTCVRCGKIVEFENADIEEMQELVARNNGFQLTGHVLELYGLCQTCQKKSPTRV